MTLPSLPACNLCSATSSHPFLVNGDYTIRQCSRCGLRYLDPQPTAAQLVEEARAALAHATAEHTTRIHSTAE